MPASTVASIRARFQPVAAVNSRKKRNQTTSSAIRIAPAAKAETATGHALANTLSPEWEPGAALAIGGSPSRASHSAPAPARRLSEPAATAEPVTPIIPISQRSVAITPSMAPTVFHP